MLHPPPTWGLWLEYCHDFGINPADKVAHEALDGLTFERWIVWRGAKRG